MLKPNYLINVSFLLYYQELILFIFQNKTCMWKSYNFLDFWNFLQVKFCKNFLTILFIFFKSEVALPLQFHKYFWKCIHRFVLRFRGNRVLHLKYIDIGIIICAHR